MIKAEMKDAPTKPAYPYLGICRKGPACSGTFVVNFTSKGSGQVIYSENPERVLHYHCSDWRENLFEVFNGQIIWQNG